METNVSEDKQMSTDDEQGVLVEVIQPTRRYPFEDMGNVLLDAMQGTLICLDNHHVIVDVSPTVKRFFGFEQVRCQTSKQHRHFFFLSFRRT